MGVVIFNLLERLLSTLINEPPLLKLLDPPLLRGYNDARVGNAVSRIQGGSMDALNQALVRPHQQLHNYLCASYTLVRAHGSSHVMYEAKQIIKIVGEKWGGPIRPCRPCADGDASGCIYLKYLTICGTLR